MKKLIKRYKLSRSSGARKALVRSLVRAIVFEGNIKTTYTKAKMVQPIIDKLVNTAKRNDLASRRKVYAYLGNSRKVTSHLFDFVAPLFAGANGGYTKMSDLGVRRGDNSNVSRLEWSKEVPAYVALSKKKSTKKTAKESKSKITKTK